MMSLFISGKFSEMRIFSNIASPPFSLLCLPEILMRHDMSSHSALFVS